MALDDQRAVHVQRIVAQLGEAVTYHSVTAGDIACNAVVEIGAAEVDQGDDTLIVHHGRMLVYRDAANVAGPHDWAIGDYVTIAGERWEVVTETEKDNVQLWVEIQRVVKVRTSGRGHLSG